MEPLEPPYEKYNMIPWDSNDTERLEPEDAEVVREAYPPSNVQNIFTKICWSPKDKWELMARCSRIIREKRNGSEDNEAEIRRIIASDVYTGFQIAIGEKEREDPIWNQEERDLLYEAFPTSRANTYLNKKHFAKGNKDNIIQYTYIQLHEKMMDDQISDWQDTCSKAAQESRDNMRLYNDATREIMDPDWYQGRDDND